MGFDECFGLWDCWVGFSLSGLFGLVISIMGWEVWRQFNGLVSHCE